jgi:3-hydroxyisobutyrate dehydrogenase-like beta-hydroxyacid dehydrogenase
LSAPRLTILFPYYLVALATPRPELFGFRMELMVKDMRLALEEAEALGLVMPTCGAARVLYGLAMAQGGPYADVTELVRVTEGWAGVEVAARGRNAV